jgi:chaperone modulatory protein CbpM
MRLDERSVVAEVRRLTLRELRFWVREGWVQPSQGEAGPVFDDVDLARIRLLCDLRKDMDLPTDALPVVLTLIDHLHETRRCLRHLADAIEEQPETVRRTVSASFEARLGGGSRAGGGD